MDENQAEQKKYHLAKLKENTSHVFELTTRTNCIIPISLDALIKITPAATNKRGPNAIEALKLANVALGQGADPYSKECGLMPVYAGGFHYEVWVAAQVRMRKAQAQPDYDGYKWGWITEDFVRHEAGRNTKADPSKIIGAWGQVARKGQTEPFYHEVFLAEVKKETKKLKSDGTVSKGGSWDRMPITMLAKVIRDQTHKFAYADKMGNLNTEDELRAYNVLPAPICSTPTRENRRKPAQDVTVRDAEPPVSDTEGGTEADDAGSGEDNGLVNITEKYAETVAMFSKLAGIENAEEAELKLREAAAFILCVEEEEVDSSEKFTADMLSHIIREIQTNGIPQDL